MLNKFLIPAILVAVVMVAGVFAFMPVEKASTPASHRIAKLSPFWGSRQASVAMSRTTITAVAPVRQQRRIAGKCARTNNIGASRNNDCCRRCCFRSVNGGLNCRRVVGHTIANGTMARNVEFFRGRKQRCRSASWLMPGRGYLSILSRNTESIQ